MTRVEPRGAVAFAFVAAAAVVALALAVWERLYVHPGTGIRLSRPEDTEAGAGLGVDMRAHSWPRLAA
jgi:hypothetical protein